jgi:CrcB protein
MTPFERTSHKHMFNKHPLIQLETVVLIGIGGFAGSNLRYFVAGLLHGLLGTLVVNTIGSFVLGIVLYEAMYSDILSSQTRLVGTTGFLSSFTTYSTFALQTALVGSPLWMIVNIIATYALGFGGVFLGREVAQTIGGDGEEGSSGGME